VVLRDRHLSRRHHTIIIGVQGWTPAQGIVKCKCYDTKKMKIKGRGRKRSQQCNRTRQFRVWITEDITRRITYFCRFYAHAICGSGFSVDQYVMVLDRGEEVDVGSDARPESLYEAAGAKH
jgi:hypothetical protein